MSVERETVLALLARAERVLGADLEAHPCPHGHTFETRDPGCTRCEWEPECRFVAESQVTSRSLNELLDALEFAATQVEGLRARARHDPAHCPCKSCSWLREAWALTRTPR
jgi:hypothetical protein